MPPGLLLTGGRWSETNLQSYTQGPPVPGNPWMSDGKICELAKIKNCSTVGNILPPIMVLLDFVPFK